MSKLTRRSLAGLATAAAALAAPSIARAQTRRWRMVTSWPKRLPGPGMSAERVAERIAALSGARMHITVHAAGELTPAFEVLDAVGGGVAAMYYGPGFNRPNGTGECIVSLKAWEALDAEGRAIVAHACATEANFALAEMERLNAEALGALIERHGVQLKSFPRDVVDAAR